jgi:hypothetical protein
MLLKRLIELSPVMVHKLVVSSFTVNTVIDIYFSIMAVIADSALAVVGGMQISGQKAYQKQCFLFLTDISCLASLLSFGIYSGISRCGKIT